MGDHQKPSRSLQNDQERPENDQKFCRKSLEKSAGLATLGAGGEERVAAVRLLADERVAAQLQQGLGAAGVLGAAGRPVWDVVGGAVFSKFSGFLHARLGQ